MCEVQVIKNCDVLLSIYFTLLFTMVNNNSSEISDGININNDHGITIEYIPLDRNSCPVHRKHALKGQA